MFHPGTNPVIGHALIHSVGKTHALVVTDELIWLLLLNILSLKFVPTPRKSPRFTRSRISYVNRPVVHLTNHCQIYTTFLLDVHCSFFLQLFVPNESAFAFLSTSLV